MPQRSLLRAAAIAALLTSMPVFAGMLDQTDKQKHIAVSAALGFLAYEMVGDKSYGTAKAFGLAMLPGLAKEIHDGHRSGGTGFSSRDLAANALGAALGVGVGHGMHIIVQRRPDGGKALVLGYSSTFR